MAQGNPFPKGAVTRTDLKSSVTVVLDEHLAQLDALIAGQSSRHERAIFAKQVVASIGVAMGVYALDATSATQTAETTAPRGSVADAKKRVARLRSRGQAVPRELQLLADEVATDMAEAKQMARAERSTPMASAKKSSRKPAAAVTA